MAAALQRPAARKYGTIRPFVAFACIAFCFVLSSPQQIFAAEELPAPWPTANVRLTIPFLQGSETDLLYALFVEAFAARTGNAMIPKYVSGQAGVEAWARMADDAPDGSALTVVNLPHLLLRELQPDSGVNAAAVALCHITAYSPCVLWSADPAFDSVQVFVDAARSKKGTFLVAGPGRYSAGQIAARVLDRQAGIRTTYLPYSGSIDAGKAALAKKASLFWAHSVPIALFGSAAKPLAVAATERLPTMPGVPTFRELGLVVEEGVYYGIAVPADTPEETRESIEAFFSRHASTPEFQSRAAALGFIPMNIAAKAVESFLARQQELVNAKAEEYDLAVQ